MKNSGGENNIINSIESAGHLTLNPQQKEAVRTVDGPVLLLAVPGSGKTTVLVVRLGYMILERGVAPENILTVTYTVAATRDMARRFADLYGEELASRLEFRTINGICAKVIAFYSRMIGKKPFELVTDEKKTAGILTRIYREVEGTWPTEADIKNVRTLITYIKNQMLTEKEIREMGSGKGSPLRASDTDLDIRTIYKRYNSWLRDRHLMDYDDQMVYALTILRKVPQVLARFQEQYRYICVDEAQDTSKIQHTIIALLASKYDNLFMVGDEDQSIYGFRAACPEALLDFEKAHRGAKILLMEENYRSGSGIVSAADRFIQKNTLRRAKHMVCAGEMSRSESPGALQDGALNAEAFVNGGLTKDVREISLRGRRAQYTYLAKVAGRCTEDYLEEREAGPDRTQDLKEIPHAAREVTAVLYRNNESAVPLVDRLERNGTPYRIRNAEVGFFTHRTVMDITNIIKLSYEPRDAEAFEAVYYKLGLYLNKETASLICDISRRMNLSVFDAAIRYVDLEPAALRNIKSTRTHLENMRDDRGDQAVTRILRFMGYGEYLSRSGIRDSKISILTAVGAGTDSPAELLERIAFLEDIFRNKRSDPDCPFVLSTIHASKGLEYDTVYLMDVADGIFPEEVPASIRYMTPGERRSFEEERRLFYVGMTRARKRLCVFTTGSKSVLTDEMFGRSGKEAGAGLSTQGAGKGLKRPKAAPGKPYSAKAIPGGRKLRATARRGKTDGKGKNA